MVPATLGLMHMLREREVALGHVGGAIALIGLLVMPYAWMAGAMILAIGLYRARAVQSTTAPASLSRRRFSPPVAPSRARSSGSSDPR